MFKLKSNSKDILAWGNLLMNKYYTEALASLQEERVTFEAMYLSNGYILAVALGECRPANMNREVNIMHQQVKKESLIRLSGLNSFWGFIKFLFGINKVMTIYKLKIKNNT